MGGPLSTILLTKMNVASYDPWRTTFDRAVAHRREHGVTGHDVYCSPEDMTSILVVEYFDSTHEAKVVSADLELLHELQEGGVIGAPHFTIVETV